MKNAYSYLVKRFERGQRITTAQAMRCGILSLHPYLTKIKAKRKDLCVTGVRVQKKDTYYFVYIPMGVK